MSGVTALQPDHLRVTSWVHEHGEAVRGFVLAMVRRDDVADDVVQEVFRRAWQARDRYEENGCARSYLLRIADRLVCDRARQTQREVTLDDVAWQEMAPCDASVEPPSAMAQREAKQAIEDALAVLTYSQRRVLLLRYYGELSFAEIAEQLGCPLGTALSHCRRGLLAMRKIISENES
jgi:RNA polymerase sigma-70 factor (ECF subfamily)